MIWLLAISGYVFAVAFLLIANHALSLNRDMLDGWGATLSELEQLEMENDDLRGRAGA